MDLSSDFRTKENTGNLWGNAWGKDQEMGQKWRERDTRGTQGSGMRGMHWASGWMIECTRKNTRNRRYNQTINQSIDQSIYQSIHFYSFINSDNIRVNYSQKNWFSSEPFKESISVDSFLRPVLQIHHVSVHSISTFARAAYAPAHRAHQIPLVILGTDQRSSTISLTCVNSSSSVSCAAHAFCDGVAQVLVGGLAGVAWDERYLSLLQYL